MRALFITGSFPPMLCGVGDYTATLAAEISLRDDMCVSVLTSMAARHKKSEEDKGFQLLSIIQRWRFSELPKIISTIRHWRPDVVHIQYHTLGYGKSWMPYFLPLFLKLYGLIVVQTWHEPPTRFRCLPNSLAIDALIGVEPDYLQNIRRRYKWLFRRKKTCFIPIASNIPKVELIETERSEIRERFAGSGRSMVVFFGFAFPTKRVEALFEIADPERDTIVLITHLDVKKDPYHRQIMAFINSGVWAGKVVVTGFLSAKDVARVLCAANAVVLPFQNGVRMRNGSFLAAKLQGSFIITTSMVKQGYEPESNVYYTLPGDNEEMRYVLSNYRDWNAKAMFQEPLGWEKIAEEHISLYRDILNGVA